MPALDSPLHDPEPFPYGRLVEAIVEAHEFHRRRSPSCPVLDLAMPELTGVEVQGALAERGKLLPIVFLTGRGDVRTCAEAIKNGAVDFLTKPVDRQAPPWEHDEEARRSLRRQLVRLAQRAGVAPSSTDR